MGWLASIIGSTAMGAINAILGTIGKTVTDIHADTTSRQKVENESGERLGEKYLDATTTAGAQRADVQKSQGAWGPFGIAGFSIAMAFAFHVVMIVLDSSSWHLVPVLKFYFLPWLEWQQHLVGSWKVAVLPGRFDDTEHEILRALFYVGPPSAAIAIAAHAFKR